MLKTVLAATAALLLSSAAYAEGFIQPQTRIDGCTAIVDKVRDGTITPTEWLEQNKEEFADLELELKRRNYPPQKAKGMLMGMAITLCMERKGYTNTCVSARDEEKRDLQIMRTASISECWARQVGEAAPPSPPPPQAPAPTQPALPPMSPADMAQFQEDMAIISQPPHWVGMPPINQAARFASCADYWQSLHYNRSPEARQVLYAVRVARCMHRTNYVLGNCPADFGSMLNPGCYRSF